MFFNMKSQCCVCLIFLLLISGCYEHISNHCQLVSEQKADPPEERENYDPLLTPVTDVFSECYCVAEDGILAVGIAALWAVYIVGYSITHSDCTTFY